LPALEQARVLEDWAGLRPGTPDSLPILGGTGVAGYFVATGHFRDGILLAPVTAHIMGRVVTGQAACFDLAPFSVERFAKHEALKVS
jgi:glycine oxidase